MSEHYVSILPSGNSSDFPSIDDKLMILGVEYEKKDILGGGRVYRIHADEVEKLPTDDRGPFLPTLADTGYSLWEDPDDYQWDSFE